MDLSRPYILGNLQLEFFQLELYPGSVSSWNISRVNILLKYHREKSDVIIFVEEEHEIMSDKGFFNQFMSEKQSIFQKLKKLLILIAPTCIHIERFTGCVSDWSILNKNNDWPIQKFDSLTLILGSLCYNQILNPFIRRLV